MRVQIFDKLTRRPRGALNLVTEEGLQRLLEIMSGNPYPVTYIISPNVEKDDAQNRVSAEDPRR